MSLDNWLTSSTLVYSIRRNQLTQGVLLPSNATLVKLLPWTTSIKANVFGTARRVYGNWVSFIHAPTSLGIIYNVMSTYCL